MAREDTPRGEAGATSSPITERKIKPDGTVREYPCTLVRRERGLVVVRYVVVGGSAAAGFHTPVPIPPGTVSDGWFWVRRPYNLYRMVGPDGAIVAHRFDAVADVRIGTDAVTYRDLVLDWWVLPDGRLIEEDRDELEALTARGLLSPADAARAREAARQVLSRYRRVMDEVAGHR